VDQIRNRIKGSRRGKQLGKKKNDSHCKAKKAVEGQVVLERESSRESERGKEREKIKEKERREKGREKKRDKVEKEMEKGKRQGEKPWKKTQTRREV
jgi:hypothetical protein